MTKRRASAAVATGARLVAGVLVAAACVVAVGVGVAAPWPDREGAAAQTQVTTVPGDAVLVCTGSFRALGRDAQTADRMESAGIGRITVDGDPDEPEQSSIDTPDLVGGEGAAVFTAEVEGRESPLIAASESLQLSEEDLTGLAAAPCQETSTQSWIVGGSTETGASDVLVLSNPGSVTATVTLTVFGGQQETSTWVVPAQTQIAVPFASIAAGVETPVVQVVSEGSPVRAVLQSALVRTLDPAGIDLQGSTTEASEELSFAGVQVITPNEGSATDVLRLLAVDADTEARVIVRGDDGEAVSDFTVPLTAEVPLDVALADLAVGTYSVEVTAGTALVGGVWQSTGDGAGTDFAWTTPAPALTDDTLVAVPSGPSPRLHLVNPTGTDAVVTLTALGGEEREITVAAGASELVSVSPSTVYRLSADGEIRAAVTMTGEDQLAGWPVTPGSAAQKEITVYP